MASDLQSSNDAEIIAWYAKVQRYDTSTVSRTSAAADVKGPLPKALGAGDRNEENVEAEIERPGEERKR